MCVNIIVIWHYQLPDRPLTTFRDLNNETRFMQALWEGGGGVPDCLALCLAYPMSAR